MIVFKEKPIINPGITQIIGNHTVPSIIPNNVIFDEYIIPMVTKHAENTKGR